MMTASAGATARAGPSGTPMLPLRANDELQPPGTACALGLGPARRVLEEEPRYITAAFISARCGDLSALPRPCRPPLRVLAGLRRLASQGERGLKREEYFFLFPLQRRSTP